MPPTIFVCLASYCDPLLTLTVRSALKFASTPNRLVFGVVDQSPTRCDLLKDLCGEFGATLRYVHLSEIDARGCGWARSVAGGFFAGEDYFLQIDSHTYFDTNWDVTLREKLEGLCGQCGHEKVVLSCRPFDFKLGADDMVTTYPTSDSTLLLRPQAFGPLAPDNPLIKFECVADKERRNIRGFQIAGGFVFARGQFLLEVPHDPQLYFDGEEQNVSVRAYTHGWDVWHTPDIPIYHHYKAALEHHYQNLLVISDPVHWRQEDDLRRNEQWYVLHYRSVARLRGLVFDGNNLGAYGLGNERTLAQFAEFSGIDYAARSVGTGTSDVYSVI